MHRHGELAQMRADMEAQSALYRPTAFWAGASGRIADELQMHGVECFRSLPEPLGYFVPTYGSPANGFTPEQVSAVLDGFRLRYSGAAKCEMALTQFLGGHLAAVADYRVLLAADDHTRPPYLHRFTESDVGKPIEQFTFDGRRFSRSSLNYLLGLALVKKHVGPAIPRTVLEVGGGFGTLGEVWTSAGVDGARYIDVDIPPTSFVAQYYLGEVLGRDRVATYAQTRERNPIAIDSLPEVSVLCSWQIERLRGQVDLFVNFISFQEMEPDVVQNYLDHVRRLGARWVLLRNLREGKQRRGAGTEGVEQPILGDDYPRMLPSYELVERATFPFGYRTVDGFHSELLLFRRT